MSSAVVTLATHRPSFFHSPRANLRRRAFATSLPRLVPKTGRCQVPLFKPRRGQTQAVVIIGVTANSVIAGFAGWRFEDCITLGRIRAGWTSITRVTDLLFPREETEKWRERCRFPIGVPMSQYCSAIHGISPNLRGGVSEGELEKQRVTPSQLNGIKCLFNFGSNGRFIGMFSIKRNKTDGVTGKSALCLPPSPHLLQFIYFYSTQVYLSFSIFPIPCRLLIFSH